MINVDEQIEVKGDILQCMSINCSREYQTEKICVDFRVVGKAPAKKETKFKVGDKVRFKNNSENFYSVICGGYYVEQTYYLIGRGKNILFTTTEDEIVKIENTEPKIKGFATYIGEKGVVRERTDIVDFKYSTTDGFLLYIQNDEKEVYFVKPEHFILKSSKKMYDLYRELCEKSDKLTDTSIHYGYVIRNLQNQLCKTSDYTKKEALTSKIKEFKKKETKTWDKKDFIKRYMRRIEAITNMKGNK